MNLKSIYLANDQVGALLQIIAFLVLSPEDGEEIKSKGIEECQPDHAWLKSMNKEFKNAFKEDLIKVLKRGDFFTNTHPGFPIGAMEETTFTLGLYLAEKTFIELTKSAKKDTDFEKELKKLKNKFGYSEKSIDWVLNSYLADINYFKVIGKFNI